MADRTPPDAVAPDAGSDDQVVAVLERTLAAYAGQAPPAIGLPERVRRTRRRRTVVRTATGICAALAVAAAIVVPMTLSGGGGDVSTPAVADQPADGWRWESFGGVELQVPTEWGTGITDYPWCLADREPQMAVPYVGRPIGAIPAIGCPEGVSLSAAGDRFVWFDSHEPLGTTTDDAGWIRETRQIGDLLVTIQLDDPALAERIFDSARLVEAADSFGCAPDHPLAAARGDLRPGVAWDVAAGEAVQGGSVCRYDVPDGPPSAAETSRPRALTGSRSLTAEEAVAIRDAVAAAPAGSGPNDPASCMAEYARGDEVVVVTLITESGPRELFVRYSGCDFHGVDDGTTVRTMTPEIAASVFDAALLPSGWSGVMDDIFGPLWEAQRQ